MADGFTSTLLARGPHPSLGEHGQTYGRIIGSWLGQLHNHMLGRSVPAVSVEAQQTRQNADGVTSAQPETVIVKSAKSLRKLAPRLQISKCCLQSGSI